MRPIKKKYLVLVLTIVMVLGLMGGVVSAAGNDDGLIAYWPFDEGSGTTANDVVNELKGTIVGASWNSDIIAPVPGNKYSLYFNGIDSYVNVPHDPKLSLDRVSLVAWILIKPGTSGNMNIIRKGPWADREYGIDLVSNSQLRGWVNIGTTGGGTAILVSGPNLDGGVWHHVAMTYDGSAAKLYLNGNEVASNSAAGHNIYDNTQSLRIGGQPYSGTPLQGYLPFHGYIDEVMVYDTALSQSAVKKLFDNTPPLVTDLTALPNPVAVGNSITVSATVTDNLSGVALVEYSTDDGANWNTMESDGFYYYYASIESLSVGVYEIQVRATDNVGNASSPVSTFVAVYDPSVGFVTGGGWINSPAGASALYPDATGKANFGFVSRYQRGAHVPTGNTQFQFKAGNLNFQSTEYDWLVIAGTRAQYKGSGTINGNGNYGFMLTAIDGGRNGTDQFRIKIWDKDTDEVIYDNQRGESDTGNAATVLGGGSIVIHSK